MLILLRISFMLETKTGYEQSSEDSNPDAALCGRGYTSGASFRTLAEPRGSRSPIDIVFYRVLLCRLGSSPPPPPRPIKSPILLSKINISCCVSVHFENRFPSCSVSFHFASAKLLASDRCGCWGSSYGSFLGHLVLTQNLKHKLST